MMDLVIKTLNLTKNYGFKTGCEDICISVPKGQVFGFLGPNGAGKSTLVKMLAGLVFPSSGRGWVLGNPLGDLKTKRRIGLLPENFRYQDWLSGRELLEFHASLCRMEKREKCRRIPETIELVGLTGRENHRIRTYSKGMRQRLGLACALLADPDLLFLDEPTSALDPIGRREVREIITSLREKGKTVFLNSHLLSEVEMICDQLAIIRSGRVVAQGPLNELLGGTTEVDVEISGLTHEMNKALAGVAVSVSWKGNKGKLIVRQKEDVAVLAETIMANGGRIYMLAPRQRSLEDLFIDVVREEVENKC